MSKILIVDDSQIVIKLHSTILERAGYTVIVAKDGIEAAQMVYRERPELIVLDIHMPRMNGYQVCRLLKNDPAVAHIPVVINTFSDPREAEFWSWHTGAEAFLAKGSSPVALLETVERLLRAAKPSAALDSLSFNGEPTPALGAEEILSKVSAQGDAELYATTVERARLQTTLENLGEGVATLDAKGNVVSANRFLCRLLEFEESDLLGLPARDVLGESIGPVVAEMLALALLDESHAPREGEVSSPSGQVTPVQVTMAPVRDYLGEIVGGVALVQDITRRKEIETLSQLKNDLTSMIVHDLRTPLTSLLTGLQTIGYLGDVNPEQKELLDISIDGGETLLRMINDLLDISKMEDGSLRLDWRQVDPHELIERARRQVGSLATHRGVRLEMFVGPDVELWCDDDKMLRSLVNLLSNAIKFTPSDGLVSLAIQLAPTNQTETAGELLFQVCDSGEGIPESAFGRIFEKFGQVEGRSAGRKMSTGLGLTFCKMAVEAHGGRIWVESLVGEGSTFSFVLPRREAHHLERRVGSDRRRPTASIWSAVEQRSHNRDRRLQSK